jgi:ribonuclease HII
LGEASPGEIDGLNILQATFLAMRRALEALPMRPELLLVDGNQAIPGWNGRQMALVGGDGLSAHIAAASVLAKVRRDASMVAWDSEFPEYGFSRHKGYGTQIHREALRKHGLCPIHRRSFCRAYLPEFSVYS